MYREREYKKEEVYVDLLFIALVSGFVFRTQEKLIWV